MMNNKEVKKKKLIINIVGLSLFLILCTVILIIITPNIKKFIEDPLVFRDYIKSHGIYGSLIFLLLQIFQIVISIIPGEFVEIVAGISFGWFYGFILCEIGIFIGSSLIFLLCRKVGKPIVKSFVGERQFKRLEKIDKHPSRDRIIFLIFLIPGLPKDVLTYVASFFNIKYMKFIIISMVARIPSIITSTIAGGYLLEAQYLEAVIIFIVTGIFSVFCYILSDKIMNKINEHRKSEGEKNEV